MLYNCRISFQRDNINSFALTLLLYYPLINGGILSLLSKFSVPFYKLLYIFLIGIEIIIIYGGLIASIKRDLLTLLLVYGTVAALYIVNIGLYPKNATVLIGTMRSMFLFCLPAFLLAYLSESVGNTWKYLQKYAPGVIICGLLYIFLFEEENEAGYSMWLGYQLVVPVMVLIRNIFENKQHRKMMDIIFACVGGLEIIIKGSRGPILVIIIYVFTCIVRFWLMKPLDTQKGITIQIGRHKYSIIGLIVLSVCTILIMYSILNLESLALHLYNKFNDMGYDSRTLRVLSMKDALQYTAGRDQYYLISLELIKQKPLIGYGLAGDCVEIGKYMGVSEELYSGTYAHNIILEVLLHWGIPIGTIILIYCVHKIHLRKKQLSEGSHAREFMILLIVLNLIQSMISTNYLESIPLWMLLGLALSYSRNRITRLTSVRDILLEL